MSPPRRSHRRSRAVIAVAGALGLLLALAPAAGADILTPEAGGGSPQAGYTRVLYEITLYMAIPIFLLVEGVLIFSLVRHRAHRGAPEPAQVRGNTRLEVAWTIGAAVILVILTIITFVFLPLIRDPAPGGAQAASPTPVADLDQPPVPGGPSLNVRVVGQQYLWRYDYPGPGRLFSYNDMVVPINTTITLDITSADVQHSFWIPELFGKADAVPGRENNMWFKATKPGVYRGNCAELCGENHSQMIGRVRAVPEDEYRRWADTQRRDIVASQLALVRQRRALQAQGNTVAR